MKKKNSIILLEVMIALLLIMLCLFPLLHYPTSLYRYQIKRLYEAECELIALQTFGKLKEDLLTQKIALKQIASEKNLARVQSIPEDVEVEIEGLGRKKIAQSYQLFFCKGEKKNSKEDRYRLLHVHITLCFDKTKLIYPYQLFHVVRKGEKK